MCYFTTLLLLTSLESHIPRPLGHQVGWKRVLAWGTGTLWWPWEIVPHPICFPEQQRPGLAWLKPESALELPERRAVHKSPLFLHNTLATLKTGRHSRREEVDIVGIKLSFELGLDFVT